MTARVPPWFEQALYHAAQHFAPGQRRGLTEPASKAIIAEHIFERLPMPEIADDIERLIVVELSGRDSVDPTQLARTLSENVSRLIVARLAGLDATDTRSDRETYLEVSHALDVVGAPRTEPGDARLTLAQRVRWLGRVIHARTTEEP